MSSETRQKLIPFLFAIPIVLIIALISHQMRPARRAALNTELQAALDRRDAVGVRKALVRGADPNGEESPGFTALMHAVEHGDADSVKALLGKGADVTRRDTTGKTALMYAKQYGNTELIRLLEQAGAKE